MTAEIAVHNRYAIALAADSAASISGDNSHKVFNNAEKLFELSRVHPIGLMIYGSAELQNFPWEVLIKTYRDRLADEHRDTVEEYALEFIKFAGAFYSELPESFVDTVNGNAIFTEIMDAIDKIKQMESSFVQEEQVPSITSLLDSAKYWNTLLEEAPFLEGFDNSDIGKTKAIASSLLERMINDPSLFRITLDLHENATHREVFDQTVQMVANTLVRENPLEQDFTGVVIAGYGDKEYFSCLYAFEVYGVLNGKLRYRLDKDKCLNIPGSAGIIPFAQDSEVGAFVNGLHPTINSALTTMETELAELVSSQVELVLKHVESESLKSQLKDQIDKNVETKRQDIRDNMIGTIRGVAYKITEMLEHLPKAELAYTAESLVNLTAFKRKVSNEYDSVGGPIDVALISKCDGFVWVKRKHYFSGELNKNYHLKKLTWKSL
ncbi:MULTISPECIES: hypothetical protein [Vibrio]|uniref:hypothetical protein n=1 Tax=Vibrio TaxID=662 RepID=UPI001CDD2178|nr:MULTISPECIES: hypothetical protein [Vibrio]EGR0304992.1 hypothetical protein [Vibrio alginolyticus]MCA2466083.1 hypothetical protein [Vibrio alginolyticus]MDW2194961.1 hypothetical protein [Vibrio sp. 2084]